MSHAPLHPDTRNLLAREILKAREAAEAGAKASLAALRVGEVSPAEGMSAAERSLRNRLRANGRQLGDNLLAEGKQELGYLVEEIAYQHWHRMLFARFLAENGLLREDQGDQPIDLAECEALANAEGLDIWAYAARCAQKMLPGVFRLDDPKLELRLDTPKQLELNAILKALPSQIFTATDALGWVYQYWQAKRKDEVNASGVKIGAKELSPVTQLFTEDYMVDFLLHNTLGAWWAGKTGPIEASTEEEARAKVGLVAKNGLPAVAWTNLRFVQDTETKKWTPAGGTFDGWPKKAKDITFLDPCMPIGLVGPTGSGKTTAIDIILGLLPPQSGALKVDGKALSIDDYPSWSKIVGYVPQNIFLVDDTIAANIAFGVPENEINLKLVEEVAKLAKLSDFVEKDCPKKYLTRIGERGVRLSGGQRQRIGIARALYRQPQILVLDEATSALDTLTEQAVMDAVHGLSNEITLVIVAHRLSTVRECEKIYYLEGGSVACSGRYDELMISSDQFRKMAMIGVND